MSSSRVRNTFKCIVMFNRNLIDRIPRAALRATAVFALAVVAVAGWLPCSAKAAGPLAIQGAKIITVSGETFESGTVLIVDGRIAAVGNDIDVPGEAMVIDGTGKVVMPGFIDAHNSAGMSQANEQNSLVPFLSVVDSIDPIADYFEECRRNGITTAAVVPGNSTLIGGKAAILKTSGQYVNDMLIRRDSGLKLSLRPTSGSRMSQMALLRKELDKAKKALEKKDGEDSGDSAKKDEEAESKTDGEGEQDGDEEKGDEDSDTEGDKSDDSKPASAADEGLEALKLAIQGELPVYIYCDVPMDVSAAVKLSSDYDLDLIFVLSPRCHKAAKLLKQFSKTVILDPTLVFWETDPRTREDEKIVIPEIFAEAGVPFIFQIDGDGTRSTSGGSYFWYQAATAVKYGMAEAEALAAITLEPAKLLGVDDLVGSIEVGKDADLVVLTGDPLDITTWVERTIVAGEVVYDRADDEKLKRLLSPVAE